MSASLRYYNSSVCANRHLTQRCVQVSQIIRAELSKTYNPDTIPVGELSEEARRGVTIARAAAQPQQQAAVKADGTSERQQLRISCMI
jgi:hypothetical protein